MADKKKQLPKLIVPAGHIIARSELPVDAYPTPNILVVWLDVTIDEVNNQDCQDTIAKLREIVKDVNTFTDMDECVAFIRSIEEEKVFIISSGAFGQSIVPAVHDMSQVSTIYIFCGNKTRHETWAKEWPKIRGVFTDIEPICEALRKSTQPWDQNSIAISFVAPSDETTTQNLDQLDPSFMYTQLLKEILLAIDFHQSHFKHFIRKSRKLYGANKEELMSVHKLEREYKTHSPVWWYTYPSFLYSTLNRALRLMEVDWIVSMGFFVRDLHQHITELHAEQFGDHTSSAKLTVYRGQYLDKTVFDKILTTEGGLISFNNFLSTSINRQVSLKFIHATMKTSELVGILFVIVIDPSIRSTPFANVRDVSFFEGEEEILFSMHSIFRIRGVKRAGGNSRLWEVHLTSTSDDDPQLRALSDHIREETMGPTGWFRLGKLMIRIGQFNQAERLYETLLKQTNTEQEVAHISHMIGMVKDRQGKYLEAVALYEKSIEIEEKILPPTDPELAISYSAIGSVYDNMGDYSKALFYQEKALAIHQKSLPPNHPELAASYSNIGLVYDKMSEYSKALSYYEKALAIQQETLTSNHPSVATTYNNIGLVLDKMGEHTKALAYHEKALTSYQKTLPPNHPDLAAAYSNIGSVYDNIGKDSKALECYEKALAIKKNVLPPNHPSLATSFSNMGAAYFKMNDYSKALSFFERALDIRERALPANHPSLQNTRKWIETVNRRRN